MRADQTVTLVFKNGVTEALPATADESRTIQGMFYTYAGSPQTGAMMVAGFNAGKGSIRVLMSDLSGVLANKT